MSENKIDPSKRRLLEIFRVVLWCMLAVSILFFAWYLFVFARGGTGTSHNGNLRQIAGSLGQIFLLSAVLFLYQYLLSKASSRRNLTIGFILSLFSIVFIGVQFWLLTQR